MHQTLTNSRIWRNIGELSNSVFNKGKPVTPTLFNDPKVLSSTSDKAKLFAEIFSQGSNLDYSCISSPVFLSRTNLLLDNIPVTPKMVKKIIADHDSS